MKTNSRQGLLSMDGALEINRFRGGRRTRPGVINVTYLSTAVAIGGIIVHMKLISGETLVLDLAVRLPASKMTFLSMSGEKIGMLGKLFV